MYAQRDVVQKMCIAEIPRGTPKNVEDKSCDEKRLLAKIPKIQWELNHGCAHAAKTPPVKYQLWLETENPWSKLHNNDYAAPVNGVYYLILVDSYAKCPGGINQLLRQL